MYICSFFDYCESNIYSLTAEELIGSYQKNINDVVSSVDAEYGSLQLSETQSQSVTGSEPVTQLEDVPAQLAAEAEKVAGKIKRAKERLKKNTTVNESDARKKRTAVRKCKASDSSSPRRSPRVIPVVGEGSTRESPRLLAKKDSSHPTKSKAAAPSTRSKAAAPSTRSKAAAPSTKSKAPAPSTKRKAPAPKVICRSFIELFSICKLHFSHCVSELT